MRFRNLLPVLIAAVSLTAAAETSTFNFDNDQPGTYTNFTDTSNGISATFSSSADPGGFVVYQTIFDSLTGNVLGDPGPAFEDGLSLDVGFSSQLSSVSLDFATSDFGDPSAFYLQAYDGSELVGSLSAYGTYPPGFDFPEGMISFNGATFDTIVLSSDASDFAVDNIDVTAATVTPATVTPEPSSLILLGSGLFAVAFFGLRRRAASVAFKAAPLAFAAFAAASTMASAQTNQSIFPLLPGSVSTVPSNGDVNPYGVAFVPKTVSAGGGLQPGDILVSNFNNFQNLQGSGATITRINSAGVPSTFYTAATTHRGLSAAIGILSNGWVIVGNVPTADGTAATLSPGQLSVLDRYGNYLGTIGTITTVNGPWGMAMDDTGSAGSGVAHVFVSNVLSGTISRFDLIYTPNTISAVVVTVATGFDHRADPAALVLGPSGMVYNPVGDTLYVASSSDNAVYAIPTATKATEAVAPQLLFQDETHLHGPIDIALLPNNHLVIANSDGSNADTAQPSELVEYTLAGQYINQMSIDPGNGGAFGVAINNMGWGTFRLVAVDDNTNRLGIWTSVVP